MRNAMNWHVGSDQLVLRCSEEVAFWWSMARSTAVAATASLCSLRARHCWCTNLSQSRASKATIRSHQDVLERQWETNGTSFVSSFLGFVGVLTYNNCLAVPGIWDVAVQLLQEMLNQKARSDDQMQLQKSYGYFWAIWYGHAIYRWGSEVSLDFETLNEHSNLM